MESPVYNYNSLSDGSEFIPLDLMKEHCAANNGTLDDAFVEAYSNLQYDFYPMIQSIPQCINNIREVKAILTIANSTTNETTSIRTDEDTQSGDDGGEWLVVPACLTLLVAVY
jgi:hypothetical protein